jgi:hypothetical protein
MDRRIRRRSTSPEGSQGPLSTPARLDGTLFVSATRALYLYVGPLVATTQHAHHAAQIVIAPQGLYIGDGADGRIRTRTAVIPPRLPHRHGACAHAAVLFLDGDDLTSRELSRHAEPRCETWGRDTLDVSVPDNPTREKAQALIASILSVVDLRQLPKPRHPAARRMCAYLDGGSEPECGRGLRRVRGQRPPDPRLPAAVRHDANYMTASTFPR